MLHTCAAVVLSLTSPHRLAAQHEHRPPPAQRDSAFRALQQRGKAVMGVDQYTSAHVFEVLPDGGRIELQRGVDDSAGVSIIRAHMLEVRRRFTAGDFSLSEAVHDDHAIPGVDTMRALRNVIRYKYRDLARGAEVRIHTSDVAALRAIHQVLAFQRADHRTSATRSSENAVYHGRSRQLVAEVPRRDTTVTIDGELSEDVWRKAALLTGFSSYLPLDNRPAQDSTEVLVWYSATDVYFGVRAFETHGPVHATLAARDRIDSDDYIQLLIDPFNDRRRAFVFGINPLGAQADGMRTDAFGAPTPRGQTFGGSPPANVDLNPDFVFESKGRLTHYGYEVEVRVPLKSIRFQGTNEQRWSFQALRYVQHSGYQQTWTPARRGSAAFLGQSGTLAGFRDLQRATVVEINPEFTAAISGRPAAAD
ncbi:MAG: carbohydrate binding family 9 domain-containing protein, partial [Gemmatimonadaceae bacterium]